MKKNNINRIGWLGMICLAAVLIFTSCEKEQDLGSPDRLFRPIINDVTYGGTWIKLEWDKYEGVEHFELDLSVDSFATFVEQVQTDTTFYTFENLEYDTKYYIRIKSVGDNLESMFFLNDIIKTSDVATKLNSISLEDVIDKMVKISWTEVNYDSLVIESEGIEPITRIVSEDENLEKEVIVRGLQPATAYLVKAFAAGEYQGKKSFATLQSQVFEGEVYDLRDLSEEESYAMFTQGFFDTLAINYPSGVTLVLAGGTHYEWGGTRNVTASFSMVTGYSFSGNAVLEVAGNLDLPSGVSVGKIHLEKLTFTDHAEKPRDADSNYGGTYLINISGSGSSLEEFSIESCDIRYKRGICRIKTDATLLNFSMNNCFVDSIAGYGVVNFDNSGIISNTVSITNSTIAHTYLIGRNDKMSTALGSMIVSNVTTYMTPADGAQFFRMGAVEDVTITNCLFGSVSNPEAGCEGLRNSSITNSTISNNFRTTDCTWAPILDESGAIIDFKYPIEATLLSTNSDETFADPSVLDFTVTDSKLVNKAGDPRWW